MLDKVIYTIMGAFIALLIPIAQDIWENRNTPNYDGRVILDGLKNSWEGIIFIIAIIIILLVGSGIYDKIQRTKADNKRKSENATLLIDIGNLIESKLILNNTQLIEGIKTAFIESIKPLNSDIQSLVNEIRQDRDERNKTKQPN